PPVFSAMSSEAYCSSTYWLNTRTLTSGFCLRMRTAARMPSSVNVGGMRTSMTARSGGSLCTVASSSLASGTAAMISCPASGRGGLDAVDEPGDAGVPTGPVHACPALTVVGDDDLDAGVDRGDEDAGAGGTGVLGDVRQALGDDEVGHGFGLPPDPSLEPDVY